MEVFARETLFSQGGRQKPRCALHLFLAQRGETRFFYGTLQKRNAFLAERSAEKNILTALLVVFIERSGRKMLSSSG